MSGFLKALGLDNKPDYTDKIPETLGAGDFSVHDVSGKMFFKKSLAS